MKDSVHEKNRRGFFECFFDFLYYLIVVFLISICISIIIQQNLNKDKIPDIFGYKIFMINEHYMHETLEEGDLVIVKNVNPSNLKIGDIVAFRNSQNLVTIHEIIDIDDTNNTKFTMKTLENEVQYNKYVNDSRIEGILKYKIPLLGKILLFLIEPVVLLIIILIILVIGFIFYLIAKKDDNNASTEVKDEKIDKK